MNHILNIDRSGVDMKNRTRGPKIKNRIERGRKLRNACAAGDGLRLVWMVCPRCGRLVRRAFWLCDDCRAKESRREGES